MKWLRKLAAGLLLLWGLPLSLWAVLEAANPEVDSEQRQGAIAALCLFGLPAVAAGGWLVYGLHQQHRSAIERETQALEQLFLQLLQETQGEIHPIVFATKAQLPLDQAKVYLDQKARLLNGNFDATESGGIIYRFPF
ncbi:hypothetical protein C7271_07200 [filamentous cyanobacterium CCP5]|nr:hypothetical protein C7271_07200 [filamentous cyanobacterium CCP5]